MCGRGEGRAHTQRSCREKENRESGAPGAPGRETPMVSGVSSDTIGAPAGHLGHLGHLAGPSTRVDIPGWIRDLEPMFTFIDIQQAPSSLAGPTSDNFVPNNPTRIDMESPSGCASRTESAGFRATKPERPHPLGERVPGRVARASRAPVARSTTNASGPTPAEARTGPRSVSRRSRQSRVSACRTPPVPGSRPRCRGARACRSSSGCRVGRVRARSRRTRGPCRSRGSCAAVA